MTTRTRTYAVVALVVLSASGLPMVAAQSSTGPLVSPTTEELTTGWFGLTASVDDRIVQYDAGGQLRPSWVVSFEPGGDSAVRDWANSSDARRVLRLDNSSRTAVVAAPIGDMGLTLVDQVLGGSLAQRDYVTGLEANFEIGVDPVELQPQSEAFDAPSGVVQGAFDQAGVAYTDAPRGTPADVRDALGFDNVSATGDGVTVGIVDTGLNDADGAVFGNGTRGSPLRVTAARDFVNGGSGVDAVEDGSGHGTWVAASIAANTSNATYDGAVPNADLAVAKALADDGSGEMADIAAAIRWQEQQGADVLSLSLGSPLYSQQIADALRDYLEGNGTVAVIAAGNSRQNPATRMIASPADVPETGVITVGATTAEPPANASSAYFSQVGPNAASRDGGPSAADGEPVDIAAPGMNTSVQMPTTSGTLTRSVKSGTSMATPYVSATFAATLAQNPSLENDTSALRERVLEAARPVPAAGETEVGHGQAAVDLAIAGEAPATEQAAARTDAATARDTANRAYAGQAQGLVSSLFRQASAGVSGVVESATSALPV